MDEPEIDTGKNAEQHAGNSVHSIPNGSVFAYNLDERETPGGLKVRWKIRVVTGPDAARTEARQADAIRELLQWARQHQSRTRG
jgi:small-conductance mechanosensitive channel